MQKAWSKVLAAISDCLRVGAWRSGWSGHLGMSGAVKHAVLRGAGRHVKADKSIQINSRDCKELDIRIPAVVAL